MIETEGRKRMADRIILHVDCNCFYAAAEMLYHPEFAGKPLAVGGDAEKRYGIVLTANYIAKRRGVKTGMALWQARQCCPDLIFVPPRMYLYLRFSRMARAIYRDYSDKVESFGLDECWIDLTDCCAILGDRTKTIENGYRIAEEISGRVRRELGRKTAKKLADCGIHTIGELAAADPSYLQRIFGKVGLMLSVFARGEDQTPVNDLGVAAPIKSVGNSTTTPRDLVNNEDVRLVLYLLAESISERLRRNGFEGQLISVYVRDTALVGVHRQKKRYAATNISAEIAAEAFSVFRELYRWEKPIRSIGISVGDLQAENRPRQLSLFVNERQRERQMLADRMVGAIRSRYGYFAVQRGIMYEDKYLSSLNASAEDHMIHPHSYLEHGNRSGCESALIAKGR